MNKKVLKKEAPVCLTRLVKPLLIVAVGCCAALGNAWAINIGGDSVGIFVNPDPGADNPSMTVFGVGTSTFLWGAGGDPSSVNYQNVAFSSATEIPFKIGTLTYYNGAISAGTGADGVGLNLNVTFTLPSGVNQNFLYTMQLINTANTSDPIASADYLILSTFPNSVFNISGITYTLTLAFENLQGGGFLQSGNELHVLEENTATADLMGKVTTDISGVPEGASTLGLLGFAIPLLVALRRKLVG
ncbi:MAG: choice-of-anchor K domain-containing protein [Verrucomicrobiia bacterium]|jgi:hypothetical protein